MGSGSRGSGIPGGPPRGEEEDGGGGRAFLCRRGGELREVGRARRGHRPDPLPCSLRAGGAELGPARRGAGRPGARQPHPPSRGGPGLRRLLCAPSGLGRSFVSVRGPPPPGPAAGQRRRRRPAGGAAGSQRPAGRGRVLRAQERPSSSLRRCFRRKGRKKIINEIRASSLVAMRSFRPKRSASGLRKGDFLTTIPELHHLARQPLPGSTGKLSSPFPVLSPGLWRALDPGRLLATRSQRLFSSGSWGTGTPAAPGTRTGPGWCGITLWGRGPPGRVPTQHLAGFRQLLPASSPARSLPPPHRRTRAWLWSPGESVSFSTVSDSHHHPRTGI